MLPRDGEDKANHSRHMVRWKVFCSTSVPKDYDGVVYNFSIKDV